MTVTMAARSSSPFFRDETTHNNLLDQVNDMRKYANLNNLRDYVSTSGYGWLEAMMEHARVSFANYK